MKRVTGIGGVFFKCADPKGVREWYGKHLGLPVNDYGATFEWRSLDNPEEVGATQWCTFKSDTKYLDPSKKEFMINYRVENLVELIEVLKQEGVEVVGGPEVSEFGKFAWIMDPEGNKIELWEPAAG